MGCRLGCVVRHAGGLSQLTFGEKAATTASFIFVIFGGRYGVSECVRGGYFMHRTPRSVGAYGNLRRNATVPLAVPDSFLLLGTSTRGGS